MIYRILPFSMILNDHTSDFKSTSLFNVEYLATVEDRDSHNGILIGNIIVG